MAAPQKKGLDYFPFDCDFFSDIKVRLLRSRYGADGVSIYLYILCEAYKNSYFVKADDDFILIMADDLNMTEDKVRQVISFLLERSLLDSTLFQSDAVLTSTGIQRRFQEAVKVRAAKNPVEVVDNWLLSESETKPYIRVTHHGGNSENNGSYSENNPSNSENNSTKKSKVKESKEKKSKGKDIEPVDNLTREELVEKFTPHMKPKYRARLEEMREERDRAQAEWDREERKR